MSQDLPGYVSVWIGRFGSSEELDEYFEEQYDNDAEPISEFARDFQLTFYDHDFIEVNRQPNRLSVRQLFESLSYSSSFIDEATTVAAERSADGNTGIALFNFSYSPAVVEITKNASFIGTFPYDIDAASVSEPEFA